MEEGDFVSVFIGNEGYVTIDGNWISKISYQEILSQVQSYSHQNPVNLSIQSVKIQQQNNTTIQQIFTQIESFDWWSISFRNCSILDSYLSYLSSYTTHYLLFYYSDVINPIINLPLLEQLTFTNTKIMEGYGSFLKHYPKLAHVFTANLKQGDFLTSKIKQFNLNIEVHVSDIFK